MKSVRLGLMPPLTGVVGMYGAEISRAGRIACEEVNRGGGVLGEPLELVIEDDCSLPDSAVRAAKHLVEQQQCCALIGNLLSNSRIAVAYQVAEPRRVPYLNFSFYEGSILSRYFFHFAALPNQQIEKMIPFMREKFGARMFLAGNNYEWPRGSIDAAKRALLAAQGVMVGEEYRPLGISQDAVELLLDQVETATPDVFVPYFAGEDQLRLLTGFSKRGLRKRMAVVMGHYDEVMSSRLPVAVREGLYSCNTYFMSVATQENRRFLEALAASPGVDGLWPHGNGIVTNFGEATYICVKAFALAANRAGTLDPEALVDALASVELVAPQGHVRMDPATHHARVNTYLTRCEADGSFAIIANVGASDPQLPERYRHLRIATRTRLEDEVRLQSRILEQMSQAVLLVSAQDAQIHYANPGAERMFGYGADELLGRLWDSLQCRTSVEHASGTRKTLEILSRKGVWEGELELLRRDSTSFYGHVSASTFTHPVYGEVWLSVCSDVSKQVHAQLEIRASEERLREAQRVARLGSWEWNAESNAIRWSQKYFHIVGRDPASGPPTDIEEHARTLAPESHLRLHEAAQETLRTGKPFDIDLEIVRLDGGTRWVAARGEAMRREDNSIIGLRGTALDITERKRAEEGLRVSEARFLATFEQAAVGIGMVALDGRWLRVNHRLCSILGYTSEELMRKTLQEVTYPEDLPASLEQMQRVLRREIETFAIEQRYVRSDGSVVWIELYAALTWKADGSPDYLIAVAEDIQARKSAQEEVRQLNATLEQRVAERTAELTASNEELDSFAYAVSHDLRAPLRAMIGFSQVILEDYADQLPSGARDDLLRIVSASESMSDLIDGLLALSRDTRGELRAERIDVSALATRLLAELASNEPARRVAAQVEPGLTAVGDARMIEVLLRNLLGNAWKYTGRTSDALIRVYAETRDGKRWISVADNGAGFDMTYAKRLFQPFQRFHRQDEFAGIGIGLATAQRIVHRHQGSIEATSAPAQGAVFRFSLPDTPEHLIAPAT